MKPLNKTQQPEQSSMTPSSAMQELAALSMPVDPRRLLASVDEVLANAMQTINDSLQQSSDNIDAARQCLLQNHPSLEQAFRSEPYQESYQESYQENDQKSYHESYQEPALGELQEHYQDDFMKDQLDYQHSMLAQQDAAQAKVAQTQAAIGQALETMEQKMRTQQQAYEHQVLSNNVLTLEQPDSQQEGEG